MASWTMSSKTSSESVNTLNVCGASAGAMVTWRRVHLQRFMPYHAKLETTASNSGVPV